jgi:hypothetical protein
MAPWHRLAGQDQRKCGRTARWHPIFNGKWHGPSSYDHPSRPTRFDSKGPSSEVIAPARNEGLGPLRALRVAPIGGPSECVQGAEDLGRKAPRSPESDTRPRQSEWSPRSAGKRRDACSRDRGGPHSTSPSRRTRRRCAGGSASRAIRGTSPKRSRRRPPRRSGLRPRPERPERALTNR